MGPRDLLPLLRPHRRALTAAAALSLVAAGGALAQPALVARVIDVVGSGGRLLPIVSLLVLVLLAAGALGVKLAVDAQRPKGTDVEQIREMLRQGEAAAERAQAGGITKFISEDYQDSLGMTDSSLKYQIRDYMKRNGSMEITVPERSIEIRVSPDGKRATASFQVSASTQREGGRFSSDVEMSIGLAKEAVHYFVIFPGEEWKVVSADGYAGLE